MAKTPCRPMMHDQAVEGISMKLIYRSRCECGWASGPCHSGDAATSQLTQHTTERPVRFA